jgi:hypothetical protein
MELNKPYARTVKKQNGVGMFSKLLVLNVCVFACLTSASANQSLSVFASCAKELDGALKEARAMIANNMGSKPQYNIVVGAPYGVGYEYFKVDYTILSEEPQSAVLEFKFWYDGDHKCNRVEVEDYVY